MQILEHNCSSYYLFFRLGSRQSSSRRKRRGWFTCLKKSRSGAASTMIVFYCCYPYIVDIASIMIVIVIVIISFYMTGHWLNIFCENSLKTEAISHGFDFDLLHQTPPFLSLKKSWQMVRLVLARIVVDCYCYCYHFFKFFKDTNGQVGPRQDCYWLLLLLLSFL